MKIHDITIPITTEIPVWPGDPGVQITRLSAIEKGENANVSHLSMGVHTGTHVDAPIHFLPNGAPLDQIQLERFIGKASVVGLTDVELITAEVLSGLAFPATTKRLLFKTKNSQFWSRGEMSFQENFVALSPDAAQYLVEMNIQLVGIDYLSIAPFRESTPTHTIFLNANVIILEGIDLSRVPPGDYLLYCLPLKIQGVDGAPVRAILVSE